MHANERQPAGWGKDCRLIVYPRGQSQPPMHLSMFLEVTDPRNQEADWSCFVSHRLSVINQHRDSDKSVSKESQNRYSKAAKDWGWREFVTLTSLFDTDLGFLVSDTVVLCAEVLPTLLFHAVFSFFLVAPLRRGAAHALLACALFFHAGFLSVWPLLCAEFLFGLSPV